MDAEQQREIDAKAETMRNELIREHEARVQERLDASWRMVRDLAAEDRMQRRQRERSEKQRRKRKKKKESLVVFIARTLFE